jgi:predicted SnoaL-like aldol condensation-catalyzing enzyme
MDNRETAVEFLRMCARGAVRDAYARFVAMEFVHHNAWFPGDRESLLLAMEQSAAKEPNKAFEPRQVVDGGERIAVLSHLVRADAGVEIAVVHILRFEGGKIVEMWDVGQEIPADSPNALGMF